MGKKKNKRAKKKYIRNTSIKKKNDISNLNIPNSFKDEISSLFEKPNFFVSWFHQILWLYIFIRLFLTDFDLEYFTNILEMSDSKYILYRNILFGILLLLIWTTIGNKRFFKSTILFFLYPFYPLLTGLIFMIFWSLPKKLIAKNYNFLFYNYIDNLISLIVNFRNTAGTTSKKTKLSPLEFSPAGATFVVSK